MNHNHHAPTLECLDMWKNKTVLISAGGTGGHVYPGLAIAEHLRSLGATTHWLGTKQGIESRLVPEADIPLHTLVVQGVRGNGMKRLAKAPFTLAKAIIHARSIIKRIQPDIFIGFGGFASGPGAVAAKLCGVPVAIHEQNAAMGATNRIVSHWAQAVMLGFPITGRKGTVTGNPIRTEISQLAEYQQASTPTTPYNVLVVGGSLGAKAINEAVPQAILPLLDSVTLTHQTGRTTYAETLANYTSLELESRVNVCEYIDDMHEAYKNADIVIARAGALTVSELASIGLPAVFVPLPHAVDNHQYLNAQCFTDAKAGIIIEQKNLTPELLNTTLTSVLETPVLKDMSNNALTLSHADAVERITHVLTRVVQG